MIVDVHAHVIVPEITRGQGGEATGPPDGWRPAVRRDRGAQLVEFGGRTIRSAVGEFIHVERMLQLGAAQTSSGRTNS